MFWLFKLERKICSCICCFICFGPILVIIGIALVASSAHDSRGELIEKYNDAVVAWNSTHQAEFESFYANTILVNNGNNANILNLDTSADVLSTSDKRILSYSARKLVVSLSSVIPPMTWNPSSSVNVQLAVYENSTHGPQVLSTSVQPMKQTYITTSCDYGDSICSECSSKNGQWTSSGCLVRSVVSGVCVKIDRYASGSWYASTTPGNDIGCGGGGNWQPASYSSVNGYPSSPTSFSAQLTGGTFSFGLSTKDKIKYGFILIIIGGVCVVPAVLLGVFCYRHLAKKHHHHHHHHHHYQPVAGYGTYH